MEMQIKLNRLNDAIHFEAVNEKGNRVEMDGAASIGGQGKGMSPMELLLAAVGACGAFDTVDILKKQRQDLQDIRLSVTGDRADEGTPKPFRGIHIHFDLFGTVDAAKAERAVQLAVEKYCSVAASFDPKISITHSFKVLQNQEAQA